MRVLITAAGRAIGAATANELTRRGHDVVATARDLTLLEPLDVALRLPLDVCDDESVRSALAAAGEVDALVNNAALSAPGPVEDFPIARFRAVLETNTIGPLRMVQAVLPQWRERGHGVVVNVSSVQGRVATPLEAAYAASKHALEAISESLHLEAGHFGIRTVVIEPGYIAPGMKASEVHLGPPEYGVLWSLWDGLDDKLAGPGGRPGPELVAQAIADAIEDPATPLRVAVGQDAAMVLGARQALGDREFEAAMRDTLDFRW